LPYARGNAVKGVGVKSQVLDFYKQINAFEIFGTIVLGTYVTTEKVETILEPIPDKIIVVYVPENLSDLIYVAIEDSVSTISISYDADWLQDLLYKIMLSGKSIVTNDGKGLVKRFQTYGNDDFRKLDIHDVILNENIIRNGEVELKSVTEKSVYKRYGLIENPDLTLKGSQLCKVYLKQKALIKRYGLKNVAELEMRVIWVIAKIESAGIKLDSLSALKYREQILEADINENEIKQIDKYVSMANNDDGRYRDKIDQLNTKTGRLYRFLQQVKKKGPMRSFFIARDGYKLIKADYSQQEPRIVAALSGDENMIDLFRKEKDIYYEVSKIFFKETSLSSDAQRKITKTIVNGIHNGRGCYSIHSQLTKSGLSVSLQEVQSYLDQYNRMFQNQFKWRDNLVRESRNNGAVYTKGMGRRLIVSNEIKDTSIVNFPVQGTGSDGFKIALLMLDAKLKDLDAKIVHILHDEIIVEARDDIAKSVSDIVKEVMEKAFDDILADVKVPMLVKPKRRDVWG